ncbi:hypothetical protein [Burkholderia vietnamiensis]|uniref:hypothetical protein n=1 Tax=Burkholderia vietnamiensis TaxID=60552 RepID=UPI000841908A|nr:hypothetical protein [Burkholderia vietnamiensis]AOJ17111.1 hypothetical protein WJ02_25915 [Burkholderia vietnamiensis]
MKHNNRFAHFASTIQTLDLDRISKPADIPATFTLGRDGALTSHYIPFDYVNTTARLVLVGITPGFTQWKNAMREAQRQLATGASMDAAHLAAKRTGAFSGAMRPNLIALLDHIGLHRWLGLASCDQLFGASAHLVQTTSILRHPVFVDGTNYNGTPGMVRTPFLQQQIEAHFAEEAKTLSKAVFVPLGPRVSEGLDWLASRGVMPADRILHGLPHPSGANAERIAYFLGRKARSALSAKTDATRLDSINRDLNDRVLKLR